MHDNSLSVGPKYAKKDNGIFGFLKLKWKHVISNQQVLQITWQSNDALSKE